LADIVFGKYSPSGKLPISYVQDISSLPAFDSYSMKNRTYRYQNTKNKYPFAYGLSYGKFEYQWTSKPKVLKDSIQFSIEIKNISSFDAAEVAEVYISYPNGERMPIKELKAFQKKKINKNGFEKFEFSISKNELKKWDLKKSKWKLNKGTYNISIGSSSEDIRLKEEISIKN
jgi:beta-glucosidase